jgi:Rieske Fe-S protein
LASSEDPRLLIVGGADHKTGQAHAKDHAAKLREYVSQRFSVQHIKQQWSAEFFEPADGLPMIGRVPMTVHLYLATGYSGTGLTYGTAAGKILAEMVLAGSSPDGEPFSPARIKPLAAAKGAVRENLNAALHLVGDRFDVEQIDSFDSLPNGEGRIVKWKGEKHAAYRDEQGQLHLLSPVCTHAGCFVQWNNAERTWDCPCHGGRFSPTGDRLYGPPASDLVKHQFKE